MPGDPEYLAWDDRPFYLYDTVEPALDPALPPNPFYATGVDDVRENFAEWPGIRLVVGKLSATFTETPHNVAFLHVDLNQAPLEQAAVRHFWPRMAAGAVLVYDDYGFEGYAASRRAADELSHELGSLSSHRRQGKGSSSKRPARTRGRIAPRTDPRAKPAITEQMGEQVSRGEASWPVRRRMPWHSHECVRGRCCNLSLDGCHDRSFTHEESGCPTDVREPRSACGVVGDRQGCPLSRPSGA